jgi:dTMP kinase
MTYIAIEGIDGSGTTTQAARLVERLSQDSPVLQIHEPTDSPIGKLVREFFEAKHGELPPWRTMMHLFQADRELLMSQVVEPAIAEGKHVVSDRCWLSTLVYQTVSAEQSGDDRSETASLITLLNKHIRYPDLIIILEIPFERALERRRSRAVTAVTEDHFERREAFMRKVHKEYSNAVGPRIVRIDADRSIEDTEKAIFSEASALL